MPGHLSTRIVHAATQPVVRTVGPALAEAFKHFLQFVGFLVLGCVVIVVAAIFRANEIPWQVIKSAVAVLGVFVLAPGFLVVIEQVRLTYEKQSQSVYEPVGPMPQRRPVGWEPDDEPR